MENDKNKLVRKEDLVINVEDGLIKFSHTPEETDELLVSSHGYVTFDSFSRKCMNGVVVTGFENFEFYKCQFFFGGFRISEENVSEKYYDELLIIIIEEIGL